MTTDRDFDVIARAWLDLMPDEAPDRTVAAVLQAVETTPQVRRPIRWLTWRSSTMNRLPIALGAAAVVVVAGTLLLSRAGAPPTVGASPTVAAPPSASIAPASPSSGPSAVAGGPVDAALQARWMGGHTSYVSDSAGSSLAFSDRGVALSQSNLIERGLMIADASSVATDQIRLTATAESCTSTDAGTYRWSLSPSGRTLTLTAIQDACPGRSAAVTGTWWREGCRDPNTGCLGELDAATYGSQYVRPILAAGEAWSPAFGAVTYAVPDGWANYTDYPSVLGLAPASAFASTTAADPHPADTLDVLTQVKPTLQTKACSDVVQTGIDSTPAAFVAYLRTVPGLKVGPSTPTTIGGLAAVAVDLTVDDARVRPCAGGERIVGYMFSGESQAIGETNPQRLILTAPSSGSLVAVRIEAGAASRFDAFVAQAMPIVQSLTFR